MSDPFTSRYSREPSSITSSKAVGRIAEVVAAARASLQEPSRPHTPQTMDQRLLSSTNFSHNDNRSLAAISNTTMQKKLLTRRRMEGLMISESLALSNTNNQFLETPLSSRPSTSSSHSSSYASSPRYDDSDKYESLLAASSSTSTLAHVNAQQENSIRTSLKELFEFLVSSETVLTHEASTDVFPNFLTQLKTQLNQIYQKLRLVNTKEQAFPGLLHRLASKFLSFFSI